MAHFHKNDITLSQATCHIEFNSDENDEGLDYSLHNFMHCLRSCNFHNFFSEGRFININL